MTLFRGQSLACIKQDRTLFEQIDLSVNPSEILYVRGPNGAGKTSLLRILVGLSEPADGAIFFNDQDIRSNREDFHQSVIYFGHRLGLNLVANAVENLQFWCQLQQVTTSKESLYQVLAELGLVGLEDLPVGQLSAGQQRRVALARLWLKKQSKIWVLDEPFTALDVQGIALVRQRIVQHLAQQGAVIITSHQALDLDYRASELQLEYRL